MIGSIKLCSRWQPQRADRDARFARWGSISSVGAATDSFFGYPKGTFFDTADAFKYRRECV